MILPLPQIGSKKPIPQQQPLHLNFLLVSAQKMWLQGHVDYQKESTGDGMTQSKNRKQAE